MGFIWDAWLDSDVPLQEDTTQLLKFKQRYLSGNLRLVISQANHYLRISLSRIFVQGFFCKLLSKHVWQSLVPCLKFHAFRTFFWTLKTNASEVWDLLFFEMHLILDIQTALKLLKFLVVSRSDVHIDFGVCLFGVPDRALK